MLRNHLLSNKTAEDVQRVANSDTQCPKCDSPNIDTQERGFKLGRAALTSIILTPVVGGIIGMMGRKKLVNRCMDCGKIFKFKPSS